MIPLSVKARKIAHIESGDNFLPVFFIEGFEEKNAKKMRNKCEKNDLSSHIFNSYTVLHRRSIYSHIGHAKTHE